MCGTGIALKAILKIMNEEGDIEHQKEIFREFIRRFHQIVTEKHLQHMEEKYRWEEILDGVLKGQNKS